MPFTAQDVIDRAVHLSELNSADLVDTTKLIKFISSYERFAYIRAAQLNPEYFGRDAPTTTRTKFTDSWDLTAAPGGVAAVTKAEVKLITGSVSGVVVGDKVNLVDFRFPDVEVSPRAYIRGRKIFGYKTELGAADANMVTALTAFYSELPPDITNVNQTLFLPDEWVDLVVYPIAKILAIRDRRVDAEVQLLEGEYTRVFSAFETAVMIYDHGAARPLPSIMPFPVVSVSGGGQR